MIVRFPDQTSLAHALKDLLALGVPEQRITPYFESRRLDEVGSFEHQAFLTQLHVWALNETKEPSSSQVSTQTTPYSALFKEHGGTLNIKCPQLEQEIIEIILEHEGVMVG